MLKEVDIEKAVTRRFPEPVVLVVSKRQVIALKRYSVNKRTLK